MTRQRSHARETTVSDTAERTRQVVDLDRVIIRFAGDSGDGMQLTGDRFTSVSAMFGNDLATLPEIPRRDPSASRHARRRLGVPDPHLGPRDHHAWRHAERAGGDEPGCVAQRAAPARVRRHRHRQLGHVRGAQPREGGLRAEPARGRKPQGLQGLRDPDDVDDEGGGHTARCEATRRGSFEELLALGLVSWMYTRPVDPTLRWITERFGKSPQVADANTAAFKAGYTFGETAELFDHPYNVKPAVLDHGTYTNITGNTALAWGIVAAGQLAKLPVFLGSYPITPASDILHGLSKHKNFGVSTCRPKTRSPASAPHSVPPIAGGSASHRHERSRDRPQARDHGPGCQTELPLIIVDVQRGGPSTGLPPRPNDRPADGDVRPAAPKSHCPSPRPSLPSTASSPRWKRPHRLKYTTPVVLLSDGYLANGSEPWRLPDIADLPPISVNLPPRRSPATAIPR